MKIRHLAVTAAVLLAAGIASAEQLQTLDSTHYSIESTADGRMLELTRRSGEERQTMIVPSTDDEAVESQAHLLWDSTTSTLFVVWQRSDGDQNEIRMAWLDGDRSWSEPVVIAPASSLSRAAVQAVLTRAASSGAALDITLIHMVWWTLDVKPVAEYGLVAIEGNAHISTEVASIGSLSEHMRVLSDDETEAEDTGEALHPPLAMAKADSAVDVVYGDRDSTVITRIRLEPVRIAGNARAWRPVGRTGDRTGRTRLVSNDTQPVRAFLNKGRIVLYTADAQFRFVVYENGEWSPLRMIQLDEKLSSDQVLQELRRTIDDLPPVEAPPQPDQE